MSVNKHRPHVFILPEDDANRQLALGFALDFVGGNRQMDILEVAGGWEVVIRRFLCDQRADMERYHDRYMILLLDFDDDDRRLESVHEKIPGNLRPRVFVIGTRSEPEDLRPTLGSFEMIGLALAKDCREDATTTWDHPLLRHNASELARLREHVRPILFPG